MPQVEIKTFLAHCDLCGTGQIYQVMDGPGDICPNGWSVIKLSRKDVDAKKILGYQPTEAIAWLRPLLCPICLKSKLASIPLDQRMVGQAYPETSIDSGILKPEQEKS